VRKCQGANTRVMRTAAEWAGKDGHLSQTTMAMLSWEHVSGPVICPPTPAKPDSAALVPWHRHPSAGSKPGTPATCSSGLSHL
jgi:hypothetical protein